MLSCNIYVMLLKNLKKIIEIMLTIYRNVIETITTSLVIRLCSLAGYYFILFLVIYFWLINIIPFCVFP